jgi:hypothetical protein
MAYLHALKKTAGTAFGLTFGTGLGITFACTMDDVIYFQMRKSVILPMMMVSVRRSQELDEKVEYSTSDKVADIKTVGWGALNFLDYMKPHAFEPNY